VYPSQSIEGNVAIPHNPHSPVWSRPRLSSLTGVHSSSSRRQKVHPVTVTLGANNWLSSSFYTFAIPHLNKGTQPMENECIKVQGKFSDLQTHLQKWTWACVLILVRRLPILPLSQRPTMLRAFPRHIHPTYQSAPTRSSLHSSAPSPPPLLHKKVPTMLRASQNHQQQPIHLLNVTTLQANLLFFQSSVANTCRQRVCGVTCRSAISVYWGRQFGNLACIHRVLEHNSNFPAISFPQIDKPGRSYKRISQHLDATMSGPPNSNPRC